MLLESVLEEFPELSGLRLVADSRESLEKLSLVKINARFGPGFSPSLKEPMTFHSLVMDDKLPFILAMSDRPNSSQFDLALTFFRLWESNFIFRSQYKVAFTCGIDSSTPALILRQKIREQFLSECPPLPKTYKPKRQKMEAENL